MMSILNMIIDVNKYIKTDDDLHEVDLTNTNLQYEDIIKNEDILLDLKCYYPMILEIELQGQEQGQAQEQEQLLNCGIDHETLIKAAGYSNNPTVLKQVIQILDYHQPSNYVDSALYHFNRKYPDSDTVKELYFYNETIELIEIKQNNIIFLKRMIEKEDYSYNIFCCNLLLDYIDDIDNELLKNIIIKTLNINQFYDEDIEFICKCMSLNNSELLQLIPNIICLFNTYNSEIMMKLLSLYQFYNDDIEKEEEQEEPKLSQNDDDLLFKYAPYQNLINSDLIFPNTYLDRAYKEYLHFNKKVDLSKIIHYPETLSYALANDIMIDYCKISAEDVFKYPNLISVYHIQKSKLSFEEIINNKYLVEDKYIEIIKHASVEEIEGFIELTFIIPNITELVSHLWLSALCCKCGLYEMSQWLLLYKSVSTIMREFHDKVNDD